MRKVVGTLVAFVLAFGVFVMGAAAYSQSTSCANPPSSAWFKVCFNEDSPYSNTTGDKLIFIGSQAGYAPSPAVNLAEISHTLSGYCARPVLPANNWNDCLSSVKMWLPTSSSYVCIYEDSGYDGNYKRFVGPYGGTIRNFDSADILMNDKISSIFFGVNGGACP